MESKRKAGPTVLEGGDWACPACGNVQEEVKHHCRKCGKLQPIPALAVPPRDEQPVASLVSAWLMRCPQCTFGVKIPTGHVSAPCSHCGTIVVSAE